jgi:DNA-binding GntR family transcriptional regulator
LAAERGTTEARKAIRQAVKDCARKVETLDEGFELNRRVHRAIVEAAGNPSFLETFDSIWGRSQSLLMFAKLHDADLRFLHADPSHEDVLAAIEAGDGEEAQKAMTAHILSGLGLQIAVLGTAFATAEEA